jgi:8-oxo-dGTP pyrophosphatase MutT (NUDIX family)
MEKCLLVRGYKRDAGWGFPRGKLSKNETDAQCAQREVLEETGYDISDTIRDDQYIDVQLGDQATRLFIIPGVDEATPFAPHVRGEIGAFGWHVIAHLPATWEEGKQHFVNVEGGRHKFFNVWPYMKPLRGWIKHQRKKGGAAAQAAPPPPPPIALPTPTAPGHCLRSFTFDRQDILRHLTA